MKRILLFFCFSLSSLLHPCTTLSFVDEGGDRVFGKSFDWYFAHGGLFVNKRHVRKEALILDDSLPLKWASRFGSVTFNQHGREFPLGGMNEAGLVVEIMIGPTQDIPKSSDIRAVNEVQIIQYMLDSFSTIPEVIAGLDNVRVARVSSDVHYLVCDKKSDCMTVEFLDGKLALHHGADLPYNAFTNSSYEESARYASNIDGLGGNDLVPTGSDSLARFARAARQAKDYAGGDSVAYTQSFLDQVALSGRWRIAYKGTKEIHFRIDPNLNSLKKISMNQDYSCTTAVKTFSMNLPGEGNIQSKLEDYTTQINANLVNANFLLPFSLRQQMISYPETHTQCMDGPAGNASELTAL